MKRATGGLAAVLIGSMLLTACGGQSGESNDAPPGTTSIEASQEVRTLLQNNCMSCHGPDLQGRVGPSLQTIGSLLSREELYTVIADGTRAMPGFKDRLEEQEMEALADWLADQKEAE
ncbi:c-type cytochrome [Paenibacillus senegalensis]|uniref:c-type cytochrome n=1 Tax=Paenibacillus senegalensis TaxID=1465766 RepID=UPI000287CA9F|nr:cytochrome c [Paenibacillus senegalensis]